MQFNSNNFKHTRKRPAQARVRTIVEIIKNVNDWPKIREEDEYRGEPSITSSVFVYTKVLVTILILKIQLL